MTTTLTNRDKKLLAILVFVLVVGLMFIFVVRPLYVSNEKLAEEIAQNETEIQEMEQKEAGLMAARAENQKNKEGFIAAQEDLYPILKSQEIDRILTERVVVCGLSAKRLTITMPKEAASIAEYASTSGELSNPDGLDGIWIAEVDMEVSGSMIGMDTLMDYLVLQMPGIRVIDAKWGSERQGTGSLNVLSMRLQVLMSRKQ